MAPNPTLLIIIPTYNMAAYVRSVLSTILQHNFPTMEIIVVDDGSTDDTPYILTTISDRRLKVFSHWRNFGPSAARNTGLRHASGQFILPLDADDVPVVENWPTLLDTLSTTNDAVLAFGARRVFEHNDDHFPRTLPSDDTFPAKNPVPLIFRQNCMQSGSAIIKRAALERVGDWNENLRIAEDWDLWCRLACIGSFKYCPVLVIGYRQHCQSVMGAPLLSTCDDPAIPAIASIYSNALVQQKCGPDLSKLRQKARAWLTYH